MEEEAADWLASLITLRYSRLTLSVFVKTPLYQIHSFLVDGGLFKVET